MDFQFSLVDESSLSEWDLIKRDLAKLEAQISEVSEKRDKATAVVNESHDKERSAYDAFQAKLLKIREDRQAASMNASKLNSALNELKLKLNSLNAQLGTLAQREALAARMSAAEKRIEEFFTESKWWIDAAQFQRDDIIFGVRAYLDGLHGLANFNEMGTGKTLETAALNEVLTMIFNQTENRQPTRIWLTKKSLIKSNIKEIIHWSPTEQPIMCQGNPDMREFSVMLAIQTGNVLVANYEAVRTTPLIANTKWDFVFIDEVHKLKGGANPSGPTAVWKSVKDICAKSKFPVMLSGSPIMNHPREMWSYLTIFNPERFPSVRSFEREFCYGYGEEGVTVDFSKLVTVLKDQSFRHTRREVKDQFKALDIEKMYDIRNVELEGEQLELKNQMRDRFYIWLDEQKENAITAAAVIAQLTRLRQINLLPSGIKMTDENGVERAITCSDSVKLDEAVELIEELKEEGEQVLVFSAQFNEPMYELQRRLAKSEISCKLITGENSDRTQELEQDFQNKGFDVLCINMRTGSEGLNLQKNPDRWDGGASHVIFLDRWWNPETNRQAEDRLMRPGQTDVVMIHVIHADNTVDDFMQALNDKKDEMVRGIMESNELRSGADWKNYLKEIL